MNYIIEYRLAEDGSTIKKVVEDCKDVVDAMRKFANQHGADLPKGEIIGIIPTSIAL